MSCWRDPSSGLLCYNSKFHTTGEANATFSGVFGSILRDEYDRCSTVFRPSPERALRLDFSVGVVYARRYYVMDVGKASKFDWTLYLRPFRTLTW